MSEYPTKLDELSTSSQNSTTSKDTHPALHNDANAAINAVQATLGLDPQGEEATVADRIAALLAVETLTVGPEGDIPITEDEEGPNTELIPGIDVTVTKDAFGLVAIHGFAASLESGEEQELFVLPAGFRPAQSVVRASPFGEIRPTGSVYATSSFIEIAGVENPPAEYLVFDSLPTFKAAP